MIGFTSSVTSYGALFASTYYQAICFLIVPEHQWEVIADFIKSTSEQMEDYYERIGKDRSRTTVEEKTTNEAEVESFVFTPLQIVEKLYK